MTHSEIIFLLLRFCKTAENFSDAANLTAVKNGIASIRGLINHSPKLAQYNQSLADSLNAFLTNKALFYVTTPWTLKNVLSAYQKQNSIESLAVTKSDYIGGTSIANWFALDGNSTNGNKIYGDSHFFAMSMTVQDINKKAAICEFVKWITQNVDIGTEWAEAGHISMSKIVDASNDYLQNDLVKNYLIWSKTILKNSTPILIVLYVWAIRLTQNSCKCVSGRL